MSAISPWAASAGKIFSNADPDYVFSIDSDGFSYKIHCDADSLWMLVTWAGGGKMLLRMAYAPNGVFEISKKTITTTGLMLNLSSAIGEYTVNVTIPINETGVLRYTTTLTPSADLLIPFWPRDIIIPGKGGRPENTAGRIHTSQEGTRSGIVYFNFTKPGSGSVFYLQNLTALAGYCEQTNTSAGNTVGGTWPEMGFALPHCADTPLAAGIAVVLSDALIAIDQATIADEAAMVTQYLDLLARVYLHLPRPDTQYHQWPDILDKGLKDLADSPGCWSQVKSQAYLNAYVSDYDTPPEIMVQLAVLLPLLDYTEWSGAELEMIRIIKDGLPAFYNEELGTIMRWLPAAEEQLEGEEEQKKPLVMDSWYLHHPLLNLSRMALKGDRMAADLFLNSLEYAIKVARHFKYQWPVFYKMDTLEVIKAETSPGKGGEKDVPGLYAHIMLQAYELTGKKRYLQEAETSAKKLKGLGFDLFYQANNTAFSAGALLRLHKITGKKLYLELSYLCVANIFRNVQLWDCNYGNGKHFPSFFAMFPLSNAPYTACYEEQEVFCAFHDYLRHAEGLEILPSVSLLIAEYIRFLVYRAVYYYPPMLPAEALAEDVKVGELAQNLWIALEDMQDGLEKCGQVGQEVYGAGNAFGILPRHYMHVKDEDFMVHVDYPTTGFSAVKGKPVKLNTLGDPRFTCRLMLVKGDRKKLPAFVVSVKGQKEALKGTATKEGHMEYVLYGGQSVTIDWKR